MKKIIEVNRQLAGVEDFLWGEGTVTQIRGGKEVEVTRINAMEIPYGDITIGAAIAGVMTTGTQTIAGVKTFSSNIVGSITGNAGSAKKLETARTIGGVSFDGTANINLPGVNVAGNQNTTGNAGSATKLATAITINGVAFDGSANITAPTNLGITAGTTAGPIVTSSTGTNATLPTASATASGVVTTGNQTVAGIKTFTSSPIVPIPTTDFQSVPLRSTSITVDVGAGQTYTTINQALEYLSGFYPMYKKSGIAATINLKAGFVMAEQVLISGIDLGWLTIVGEDAETIITHTALTTAFNSSYPAFGVDKGGTSPVIGQLFRFNVEKVGGNKYGLIALGAGSSANVLSGKGFIGAGTHGIVASRGSTINADGANCSNAGASGIYAARGSTINANSANCSNTGTHGIYAVNASINAASAIIQNQTNGSARVQVVAGSIIVAPGINTTGGTDPIFSQAVNTLTANGIIYQ